MVVAAAAATAACGASDAGRVTASAPPASAVVDYGRADLAGLPAAAPPCGTRADAPAATTAPAPAGPTRILVVGDSVSAQIGWSLETWSEAHPGVYRGVEREPHRLWCGARVQAGGRRIGRTGGRHLLRLGRSGAVGDRDRPGGGVVADRARGVRPRPRRDHRFVLGCHRSDRPRCGRRLGDPRRSRLRRLRGAGVPRRGRSADIERRHAVLAAVAVPQRWVGAARSSGPGRHPQPVGSGHGSEALPGRDIRFVDYPAFIGEVGGPRDLLVRDDGVHLSDQGFAEVGPWLLDRLGLLVGSP
ncbi:MAG: hypothetical protein R2695_01880 [Acidimicrobiales bacterium]